MDLYLHIGTEKTGTTLLQQWLYSNIKALSEQGFFLSKKLGSGNNRSLVAFFQSRFDDYAKGNRIFSDEDKSRHFSGFLEALTEEIDAAKIDHHTMIITSEHFHSRLEEPSEIYELHKFLSGLFENIFVICYLREQSAVRTSLYSTALTAASSQEPTDFCVNVGEGNHYFDYDTFLTKWVKHFGVENMRIRIYDRSRFVGGDIKHDFISIIGNNIDQTKLSFDLQSANESLTYFQAQAFRAINQHIPFFVKSGGINELNVFFKGLVRKAASLPKTPIPRHNKSELYERFIASNQRVSDTFFNGKVLFDPPESGDMDISSPKYSEKEVGAIVMALTESFVVGASERMVLRKGVKIRSNKNVMMISPKDIDVLRDLALDLRKTEKHKKTALSIMKMVAKSRPKGPLIKRTITEWSSEDKQEAIQAEKNTLATNKKPVWSAYIFRSINSRLKRLRSPAANQLRKSK